MSAREELIDATVQLLWERGYSATSPSMIQKRSGVGQGSMYHHFPGKAGLAAEAMSRTAEKMRREVLAAVSGQESAIARLHAYLDMERQPLLGCRLGSLMQDPEVVADESLRGAGAEFFSWLRTWARQTLTEGQRSGELKTDFDPAEVAAYLAATVQGGYVLARAEQDPEVHRLAVSGVKRAVSDLAAPAP